MQYFSGPLAFPDSQYTKTELWTLVCLLFVIPLVGVICGAHTFVVYSRVSANVRVALIPVVFRKSLRLSSGAKLTNTTGIVMNLFGNNITNVQAFLIGFHEPVYAPAQLAGALGLLQVGVSMFVGLAVVGMVIPLMGVAIAFMLKFRNAKVVLVDKRVKLTNEVLSGIRILKYYSWQEAYGKAIDAIREQELTQLGYMNYIMPFFLLLLLLCPMIMPVIIFYHYFQTGNQLDVAKAFTVLSLFGLVKRSNEK